MTMSIVHTILVTWTFACKLFFHIVFVHVAQDSYLARIDHPSWCCLFKICHWPLCFVIGIDFDVAFTLQSQCQDHSTRHHNFSWALTGMQMLVWDRSTFSRAIAAPRLLQDSQWMVDSQCRLTQGAVNAPSAFHRVKWADIIPRINPKRELRLRYRER